MIADEKINIEIDRHLFESRGKEMLKGLLYVRENEYTFANDKEIITGCKDIQINDVDIKGNAISLSTRYLNVGFLKESEKKVTECNKKGEKEVKYDFLEIESTAKINEPKTIYFQQEIGTSKKWMGIYIYIKDSYTKIQEQIREIRWLNE